MVTDRWCGLHMQESRCKKFIIELEQSGYGGHILTASTRRPVVHLTNKLFSKDAKFQEQFDKYNFDITLITR